MLKIICKRIVKERPELPFFTIHDSVITLQGEEKYVEEILSEELTKQIGFPPAVNTEYWSREHLKLKDGSVFKGMDKAVQVNNHPAFFRENC